MSIVQKLVIDKELTNSLQVIVRDETGLYNESNPTGYGGGNGDSVITFEKYIFDLYNVYTNTGYRHIQSDIITEGEYVIPSIAKIVNKENVLISANEFELLKFEDGLYKVFMNLQLNIPYSGSGFAGTEVIVNVGAAQALYNNYDGIIVNGEIYSIQGIVNNNIILNRNISETFTSFKPILRTSLDLIISDDLNDYIDISIANLAKDCGCKSNVNMINVLSEIQLYQWGIKRSLDVNDISQAYEYFKMAKSLASRICI